MLQARHLSPDRVKFERAKAERASYVVSEALSDPGLITEALNGLEAVDRGKGLLWQEFVRWEISRHGAEASGHEILLHASVELRLAPRVRDLVTNLHREERALFERDVQAICDISAIDNVTKFALPSPPIVLVLYQNGPFRLVYQNHNVTGVDLLYLGWADEVPSIEDWDR
jgi:hypothetical protein